MANFDYIINESEIGLKLSIDLDEINNIFVFKALSWNFILVLMCIIIKVVCCEKFIVVIVFSSFK